MKNKIHTFEKEIRRFEYRYDLRTVFDDFLTLTICSFGLDLRTGKSHDEELYVATIAKYKKNPLHKDFSLLLALLVNEMSDRMDSDSGWDVLGEFYEHNLQRKGLSQFFTPWHVCRLMAETTCAQLVTDSEGTKPVRILDPACGSGRILLAASRVAGPEQEYFGVDLDYTCVKMTALNLFLSGVFHSETLRGNFLMPDDFQGSLITSVFPFGIFRISQKEQSRLWHIMQNTMKENKPSPPDIDGKERPDGSQLTIF